MGEEQVVESVVRAHAALRGMTGKIGFSLLHPDGHALVRPPS
jgi:hypothetical protein